MTKHYSDPDRDYLDDQLTRPEPADDDYVISDARGGYFVSHIRETFPDYDDAIAAIVKNMKSEHFWPDIWEVNDHGNLSLLAISDLTDDVIVVDTWV